MLQLRSFWLGEARDVTYLKPYFVDFTTSEKSRATDNPSKFLRHNLIKKKRMYANSDNADGQETLPICLVSALIFN